MGADCRWRISTRSAMVYSGIPRVRCLLDRPSGLPDLYRFVPYSQISPTTPSQAERLNVYTGVTCHAKSGGNEPSVLLCVGLAFFPCLWFSFAAKSDRHPHASIPQMRPGFGLSFFFLFCAPECARVRISPTTPSQAESLNVYTGVTCHAKSGGNEPSRLWSALAFFAPLCSFWREGKSNTPSQASIPQMMCNAKSSAKRKVRRHRGALNTVHTVNDSAIFSTPSRFLTERRIRQILCRVYTRAATLERQS
jgi:hypothetical protein